jgi:protein-disulfide isomerase
LRRETEVSSGDGDLAVPVGPGDHALGPDKAAITLLEYGDYECSYCGEAYPIVKELQRRFAGRLRFVFRNLPLADAHPHAERAAEAAEAVGLQGRFWEMHDLLYEHQDHLTDAALLSYAEEAGANATEVASVMAEGGTRQRVQDDLMGAIRSGANGTPTFFVNGVRDEGSWALEPFTEHLQGLLGRS